MSATGIHNPHDRNQKRLFSIKEASTSLGVSGWTIRDLIWKGSISQIKIGARVLIDIRELDGFIDTNKTRCTY
jgi:excisionase family DNA binding protein